MVKTNSMLQQCNPLAHHSKRHKMGFFIAFQIFQALKYLLFYIFIVPIIPEWAAIISIIIGVSTILIFYFASNSNPGILKRKNETLL